MIIITMCVILFLYLSILLWNIFLSRLYIILVHNVKMQYMYSDNSFDTYLNKNEKMIESISVILDILSNKNT